MVQTEKFSVLESLWLDEKEWFDASNFYAESQQQTTTPNACSSVRVTSTTVNFRILFDKRKLENVDGLID